MALTDEDKKFLIKIGQVVPVEVKVTKPPKETQQTKARNRLWPYSYPTVWSYALNSVDLSDHVHERNN
jgi:hypothetical protein